MKTVIKTLATAFIITLSCNCMFAQLGVGVHAGVNMAKWVLDPQGSDEPEPKNIPGLYLGFLAEIGLGGNFSIQPELNFVQKGFKYSEEFLGEKFETKAVFNYVEVPILLKAKFGTETVKIHVLGGPSFGYTSKGVVKYDGEEEDTDFKDDEIKQTDLGVIVGAGMGVTAGPGTAFLDLRYGLGLTNLNNADDADEFSGKNRGVGISLGYIIMLGGK